MSQMRAKYAGKCVRCDEVFSAGMWIEYDRDHKTTTCLDCAEGTDSPVQPVQKNVTARFVLPTKCYACDGPGALIKIQNVTICDHCADELIAELKARRS